MLRLTGEIFNCIPGYAPRFQDLQLLLDWLDDLDNAWLTVIQRQAWRVTDGSDGGGEGVDLDAADLAKSTPMNQTERTRLQSLMVSGADGVEEWLMGEPDIANAMETMELERSAEDGLFSTTLQQLKLEEPQGSTDGGS